MTYSTIEFYEKILIENGYSVKKYPLKYKILMDIIHEINDVANNEQDWYLLKNKLQDWVSHVRKCIFNLVDSKNDFLDILIKSELKKPNLNVI